MENVCLNNIIFLYFSTVLEIISITAFRGNIGVYFERVTFRNAGKDIFENCKHVLLSLQVLSNATNARYTPDSAAAAPLR